MTHKIVAIISRGRFKKFSLPNSLTYLNSTSHNSKDINHNRPPEISWINSYPDLSKYIPQIFNKRQTHPKKHHSRENTLPWDTKAPVNELLGSYLNLPTTPERPRNNSSQNTSRACLSIHPLCHLRKSSKPREKPRQQNPLFCETFSGASLTSLHIQLLEFLVLIFLKRGM